MMRAVFLSILAGSFCSAALAWEEPARGTDLRSDLLGTIRSVVAYDLNPPVEFVVKDLRHDGDLAFGQLEPQRPGGALIEWSSTRLAALEEQEDWYDGLTVFVFFQRLEGHWYVEEYAIGATDVWWAGPPFCDTYKALIPEYCQ